MKSTKMNNKYAKAAVLAAFLVAFGFFYLAVGPFQPIPAI
jgi:hypothetical protein